MDEGQEKKAPGGLPADAPLSPERVKHAMEDPEARRDVRIRLTIAGGMPEDVQPFTLDLDGRGQADVTLHGAAGTLKRGGSMQVGQDMVLRLLGEIDGAAMAAAAARPARIPPDSLVGRLEISVGGETQEIVFMADEEQAKTAGFHLPPAVEHMVHELVRISGQAAGDDQLFRGQNRQM